MKTEIREQLAAWFFFAMCVAIPWVGGLILYVLKEGAR
jgi:hypothetical protein